MRILAATGRSGGAHLQLPGGAHLQLPSRCAYLLLPAAQGAHVCSSPAGAHTCCYRPLRGRPGSRSRFTLHSSLDLRSFPPPALSGFRGLHFLHLRCFFGLSSLLLPMMPSWPLAALSGVGDRCINRPLRSARSILHQQAAKDGTTSAASPRASSALRWLAQVRDPSFRRLRREHL